MGIGVAESFGNLISSLSVIAEFPEFTTRADVATTAIRTKKEDWKLVLIGNVSAQLQ